MFYQGPERYPVYEGRPSQTRHDPEYNPYPYSYRPTTPSSFQSGRDYYGYPQPEVVPRMRITEPTDQGEELLNRLELTGRVPSKDKFRRMACNTFIMTGACPYSDRCVFMHDFRIKTEGAKVRTTRQTRADNTIKDTFYWPDMTRRDINRYLDAQGLPDANQRYVIPDSFASVHASFHNRGLYSVWNHFVEFCAHNSRLDQENKPLESDPFFHVSDYTGNRHIFGTYRLMVFVHLSVVMEKKYSLKTRQLEPTYAQSAITRSGSTTPGAPYTPTNDSNLNTTLNTTFNVTFDTPATNRTSDVYRTTTTGVTNTANTTSGAYKKKGLSIVTTDPSTCASSAPRTPTYGSLVIQPPDEAEYEEPPVALQRSRSYSNTTTRTNYSDYSTYSTPTTPRYNTTQNTTFSSNASTTPSHYRVTPPTSYPTYPTYTTATTQPNYQYKVYTARSQPSFASMRAASAASVAHLNPYQPYTTTYPTASNNNTTNTAFARYGAEHPSQRHYYPNRDTAASVYADREVGSVYPGPSTSRPTTPRNTDYNYNYSSYSNSDNVYDTTSGAASEGYTYNQASSSVGSSYTITPPTMEPEADWSHINNTSISSPTFIDTTIPTYPTNTNTTYTPTARNPKSVNWADLNDSSTSDSDGGNSSDVASDTEHHVCKVNSEEWNRVNDYDSTSSISNSNGNSVDSDTYKHSSVLDILQQTGAVSSDYHPTTNTDFSPWTDPMHLDLHLLGDVRDSSGVYGMRDTGNTSKLLSINDNTYTSMNTTHTTTSSYHSTNLLALASTTTGATYPNYFNNTESPIDISHSHYHSELFDEGMGVSSGGAMGGSMGDADVPYTLSMPWTTTSVEDGVYCDDAVHTDDFGMLSHRVLYATLLDDWA